MNIKQLRQYLPVLLLLFILFIATSGLFTILSTIPPSYVTAYEGAKGSYSGVYYAETDKHYTNTKADGASLHRFNSIMKFDSDKPKTGQCNVVGELTAVQIPLGQSKWVPPGWVPTEWWRGAVNWKNPTNVYEWEIKEGDTTTLYRMEEWQTSWYISLSAEWDSGPDVWEGTDETQNKRYHNLDVWFSLDISPTWYFENQTKAYFAIAKIELSHVKTFGIDNNDKEVDSTKSLRFAPMSPGSVLTIYTSRFGETQTESGNDLRVFYYQKQKLNPLYFRDKVYTYISLLDFGTKEWGIWPAESRKAKGDVVTVGFTVTQFVVGQWTVKDVGDIPADYGRTPKFVTQPGWFEGLAAWFSNPLNLFLLSMFLLIIVIVLLAIFVPGFLHLLSALTSRVAGRVKAKRKK